MGSEGFLPDASTLRLIILTRLFAAPRACCLVLRGGARNIQKQKSFVCCPKSQAKDPHGHGDAEHSCRRRRPRDADADREISAHQRLQRDDGERRTRNGPGHGRPSRRSSDPRRHAAGRRRPQPVPQGPRRIANADHHAHRARRGRRSHSRARDGRGRLPRQAVQSARIAGPHQRGAAPPGRRADRQRHQWRDRPRLSWDGGSISGCGNCAIRRARGLR